MDLDEPAEGGPGLAAEPILPMVNLVFLLLVFLLAVASLTPRAPEPVEVPRVGKADALGSGLVPLTLDAQGRLRFGTVRGSQAIAAVAAEARPGGPRGVALHADRAAPASAVARASAALTAAGLEPVWLVVEARP